MNDLERLKKDERINLSLRVLILAMKKKDVFVCYTFLRKYSCKLRNATSIFYFSFLILRVKLRVSSFPLLRLHLFQPYIFFTIGLYVCYTLNVLKILQYILLCDIQTLQVLLCFPNLIHLGPTAFLLERIKGLLSIFLQSYLSKVVYVFNMVYVYIRYIWYIWVYVWFSILIVS